MSGRLKMVVDNGVFPDLIQLKKQVGQTTLPKRNAATVVSANKVIVLAGYLPCVIGQPGSVNPLPDYVSE